MFGIAEWKTRDREDTGSPIEYMPVLDSGGVIACILFVSELKHDLIYALGLFSLGCFAAYRIHEY